MEAVPLLTPIETSLRCSTDPGDIESDSGKPDRRPQKRYKMAMGLSSISAASIIEPCAWI